MLNREEENISIKHKMLSSWLRKKKEWERKKYEIRGAGRRWHNITERGEGRWDALKWNEVGRNQIFFGGGVGEGVVAGEKLGHIISRFFLKVNCHRGTKTCWKALVRGQIKTPQTLHVHPPSSSNLALILCVLTAKLWAFYFFVFLRATLSASFSPFMLNYCCKIVCKAWRHIADSSGKIQLGVRGQRHNREPKPEIIRQSHVCRCPICI